MTTCRGASEAAAPRPFLEVRGDLVLSDDGRAIQTCRLLGVPFVTTPRVIVDLVRGKSYGLAEGGKRSRSSRSSAGMHPRSSPQRSRHSRRIEIAHPTTDEILDRVDERARQRGIDRAAYLRELVSAALDRVEEEAVMEAYRGGRATLTSAAAKLRMDPWAFVDLLRRRGETLDVTLEDWIDSAET